MRSSGLITVVVAVLPLVVAEKKAEKTLYIDSTCTDRPQWAATWTEVTKMADLAKQKIGNNALPHFDDTQHMYRSVFKKEMDGRQYHQDVWNIYNDIQELRILTGPTAFKDAQIRIYCDNGKVDSRDIGVPLQTATFAPPAPNGRLLVPEPGKYYDHINQLFTSDPICKPGTDGEVRSKPYWDIPFPEYRALVRDHQPFPQYRAMVEGHHPERQIVNICDSLWVVDERHFGANANTPEDGFITIRKPMTITEKIKQIRPENKDDKGQDKDFPLDRQTISVFFKLPSRAIFHELTHAVNPRILDVASDNSYSWENVYAMDSDQAFNNADSYALLAQWFLAQDQLKVTLQRTQLDDYIINENKDDPEFLQFLQGKAKEYARKGHMRAYDDLA